MRLLLALLLVCLGAVAGEPGAVAAEGGVVEGRYVRVQGKVPAHWLDTAAELGDALFERMQADFGRVPDKRALPLELTLHPDRAAFLAAVHAARSKTSAKDATPPPGGWTSWDPCVSHVWLQADAFDTRRLVLHELVHQFYARTRSKSRRGTDQAWYREGIAEWYGWHRRTRSGLVFGAFDLVARNPRIRDVRARVSKEGWSAFAVGSGETKADYDDAIALVGALRGTDDAALRALFRRYEQDVLERGGGAKTFVSLFEAKRAVLEEAVRAFWAGVRSPLEVTSGDWDETPEGLRITPGHGEVRADLGDPAAPWKRIEVELAHDGAGVGILFSASDPVPSHRAPGEVLTATHVAVTLWRGPKGMQLSVTRRLMPGGAPHPRGNAEGPSDALFAFQRIPFRGRCRLRVETTTEGIRVTVLHGDRGVLQRIEAPGTVTDPAAWLAHPRLVARALRPGDAVRVFGLQRDDTVLLPRPGDRK